jgi:hypothetical protein
MLAKPFAKALGSWQVIPRDRFFSRVPPELGGINGEIGRVSCACTFTTARTVAMSHFLERWFHFKFHRSAKATTVNAGLVHLSPCSIVASPTCVTD